MGFQIYVNILLNVNNIYIDSEPQRLMGPTFLSKVCEYWSTFWCQISQSSPSLMPTSQSSHQPSHVCLHVSYTSFGRQLSHRVSWHLSATISEVSYSACWCSKSNLLKAKMNTNTCLIGSSLVNNVNLLENVYCTCRGSWKPRRWMLNENIIDNMVSLLGEFNGHLNVSLLVIPLPYLDLASSKISLHLKWCLFQLWVFLFCFGR